MHPLSAVPRSGKPEHHMQINRFSRELKLSFTYDQPFIYNRPAVAKPWEAMHAPESREASTYIY